MLGRVPVLGLLVAQQLLGRVAVGAAPGVEISAPVRIEVLAVHVDRGARVGVAGDRDVGAVGADGAQEVSWCVSDDSSDNQISALQASRASGSRTTRALGITSATPFPTQRAPIVPRAWPALSSQLGWPGSRAATITFTVPSASS